MKNEPDTTDWENEFGYPRKSYVYVNGELVSVDDVEFLNIEEDVQGRDLMTFQYKGEVRKSYVVIK